MNVASRIDAYITNVNFPWENKVDSHVTVGAIMCYKFKVENGSYFFEKLWVETYPVQIGVIYWESEINTLCVGLDDGMIKVYRVPADMNFIQHEHLCEIQAHAKRVMGIVLDVKTGYIYSCGSDKKLVTSETNYQEIVNGFLLTKKQ